uniref:Phlebovirus glycoprotein G2 fusion domain-containing protein n=1 Tax=Glossina pallidipes TaxID=7398 RepID=A0A1A9ZM24_GLOPL
MEFLSPIIFMILICRTINGNIVVHEGILEIIDDYNCTVNNNGKVEAFSEPEVIFYTISKCRDKAELKKVEKMNKRSIHVNFKPRFKEPLNKSKTYLEKINNKRCNQLNVTQEKTHDKMEIITERKSRSPSLPTLTQAGVLVLGITSVNLVGQTEACNTTLFIAANGRICDSTLCDDVEMYRIPLFTGSIVCFRDFNGDLMKLNIYETYKRTKYYLQYFTSSYDIRTTTNSYCALTKDCLRNECDKNSKHRALLTNTSGTINGYGYHNVKCYTSCTDKLKCIWYRWTLASTGMTIPVYLKYSEIWEIALKVDFQNTTSFHTLNVVNPKIVVDGRFSKIPIYVTSFTSDNYYTENGLVIVNDRTSHLVTVSHFGMPRSGIIGDYQISRDKTQYSYNQDLIRCEPYQCDVDCVVPEPALNKFMEHIKSFPTREYIKTDDGLIVETKFSHIKSLFELVVGNVALSNLQIELAHCEIEILTTFACTSCSVKPYIVMKAYHIKSRGSINKTLIATFDYILKGHLMQKYTGKNGITLLIDLIVSKAFLEGVLISAITVLTFAFVSSLSISVKLHLFDYNGNSEIISGLTLRFSNPGISGATRANSVVQTNV